MTDAIYFGCPVTRIITLNAQHRAIVLLVCASKCIIPMCARAQTTVMNISAQTFTQTDRLIVCVACRLLREAGTAAAVHPAEDS